MRSALPSRRPVTSMRRLVTSMRRLVSSVRRLVGSVRIRVTLVAGTAFAIALVTTSMVLLHALESRLVGNVRNANTHALQAQAVEVLTSGLPTPTLAQLPAPVGQGGTVSFQVNYLDANGRKLPAPAGAKVEWSLPLPPKSPTGTQPPALNGKVDNGPPGTLQILGFCAKCAKLDLVLRHQQLVSKQDNLAVDRSLCTLAFEVLEVRRLCHLQRDSSAKYCLCQRMIRPCFHGGARGQQLFLRSARSRRTCRTRRGRRRTGWSSTQCRRRSGW